MRKKKLYTYKDWESGKIDSDFEKGNIEDVSSRGLGRLVDKVFEEGYISSQDYQRIKNAQRNAFYLAVEKTVNSLLNLFKEKVEHAPNPEKLLEIQIEELEERMEGAPRHRLKSVYSGEYDLSGINSYKYHEIIKARDGESIIHISNPSNIPDENSRNRGLLFFTQAVYTAVHPLLPEDAKEKSEIEPFDVATYVYNDIYDLTVACSFLERIKKLGTKKKNTSKEISEAEMPDPNIIAKQFQEQSKNPNTPYSIGEYAFVMKYARDHKGQKNKTQLISDIKDDPRCPKKLKPKGKASRSIRRWIEFYDEHAGIIRNKNASSGN